MKYCQKCGAALEESQKFCTKCGAASDLEGNTAIMGSEEPTKSVERADPLSPKHVSSFFSAGAAGAETGAQAASQSSPPTFSSPTLTQPVSNAVSSNGKSRKNGKKLTIAIVIAAIVILIILGVVIALMVGGGSNTPQDRAEREAASSAADNIQYSTYYVVNCKESISLRDAPDVSATAIAQIPFGAAVSVIEVAENGFYKVTYDGKTGYALASYLSTTRQDKPVQSADTPSTDMTYQTMYVVNCNEWITLRTSPSTSASEITKIPLGASVSFIESAPDGFYKIAYMGQTGYALASYLSTSPSSNTSPSSTIYYRVVNCDEWISLRKSPSTSADRYCTIPLGATVTYYSNAGGGFLKVGYNGYIGYALASYLTPA